MAKALVYHVYLLNEQLILIKQSDWRGIKRMGQANAWLLYTGAFYTPQHLEAFVDHLNKLYLLRKQVSENSQDNRMSDPLEDLP